MLKTRICTDTEEARQLWKRYWPRECLFDLWEVRACFDRAYQRPPYFLSVHEGNECRGMMALSWIAEAHYYGHFPGELWHDRTWLEQNRVPAASPEAFRALWEMAPDETEIRYLLHPGNLAGETEVAEDEVGFIFYPGQLDCNLDSYWQTFSGKSRKKIKHDIKPLEASGVSYRYDRNADLDLMFQMNLDAFGDHSYFKDPRFLQAFNDLAAWLHDQGMLRVTTVLIGGNVAAVDMGALWQNTYTVLAGGTRPEFPGVAKLINLHHLEYSCQQRFFQTDFLCGDFNWKTRFHLTPRALFQMRKAPAETYNLPVAVGLEAKYSD